MYSIISPGTAWHGAAKLGCLGDWDLPFLRGSDKHTAGGFVRILCMYSYVIICFYIGQIFIYFLHNITSAIVTILTALHLSIKGRSHGFHS